MKSETLAQILKSPLPAIRDNNERQKTRKEWAADVRKLLRDLHVAGMSVTVPNYSMAQSIRINFPRSDVSWAGHEETHTRLEEEVRSWPGPYPGMVQHCPYCKAEWMAHNKLEKIILAAFPDLTDRSDSMSDHFDYCLSIES